MRRRFAPVPITGPPPRLSVLVPCYNYGHYLPGCVASVLDQPGLDVDVLIIDDASPDGSGEVARRLAAADSRVRAIVHRTNQGHIATYNEGLPQLEGTYTVLISADDLVTPGALSRAVALMEAHPSVGLVYGHPLAFRGEPPVVAAEEPRSWSVWPGHDWIRAQCRRGLSIIYSPEAVVRTSVHREVGWYRPELPYSGDLELWLRFAARSDVGRVNGVTQALRREHPASMMHTTYGTVLRDLRERAAAYDTFFRNAQDVPQADRMHRLARERMAREALEWARGAAARGSGASSEGPEGRQAYVDFARSLSSRTGAADRIGAWARSAPGLARVAEAADAVRRDLHGRIRYQRWNRFGV